MGNLADIQSAILADHGVKPALGAAVLDIGCGNGGAVGDWIRAGYRGFGCDFQFKEGPDVARLSEAGAIRIIETPYRLPFDDQTFDVIVTSQVMEHVLDYPATVAEMRRVLKPTGSCLHIFPSRNVPIEPHVFVPLATTVRSMFWLRLWALLGIRKAAQRGKPARVVAQENHAYLTSSTNYLSRKQLHSEFKAQFNEVADVESSFLRNSPNARGRILYSIGRVVPVMFWLYREFWSRTILVRP